MGKNKACNQQAVRIKTLETNMSTLEKEIAALKKQYADLEGRFGELRGLAKGLEVIADGASTRVKSDVEEKAEDDMPGVARETYVESVTDEDEGGDTQMEFGGIEEERDSDEKEEDHVPKETEPVDKEKGNGNIKKAGEGAAECAAESKGEHDTTRISGDASGYDPNDGLLQLCRAFLLLWLVKLYNNCVQPGVSAIRGVSTLKMKGKD